MKKTDELTVLNLKECVGKNVKKYRKLCFLTQKQMAEQLKVSTIFLSRLENGIYGLQFKTIVQICNILDIEPYQLFEKNNLYVFK